MVPQASPISEPVVLLVDDDGAVLHAITFALAVDGMRVAGFSHPDSAFAARPSELSCVIVDQNLPGRSGLEFLDALRSDGVQAPAILITTSPSPAVRSRARERNVEILEKPLLSDALGRAVRRIVAHA